MRKLLLLLCALAFAAVSFTTAPVMADTLATLDIVRLPQVAEGECQTVLIFAN